MTDVVIVSAARTPVGSFNGALSGLPAHELGRTAIAGALERAGVAAADVSEVILGQVLQAGAGQGPARQAAINAGVPVEAPAWSLNQLCGSGLRAVALGAQQIADGAARVVVAGGQESMSQAPHAQHLRGGQKMGDLAFVDTMIKDGLWDAFHGYHMGQTAENIAARWQITREDQDRFAVTSQNRAEAAQKAGRFAAEIVPVIVKGRKGDTVVDQDEYIRHGATLDSVSGLRPAFTKVERAGWSVADLDRVESNEAFAAQALCVVRELGLDPDKVNVNGGAIAIGHPIGASGARILTTLLHEMQRSGSARGLATLCVGGGMGVALCVEQV